MNATIEKLRVRQILDMLPSLTTDSIDRIIAEAQVELWERQGNAELDMLHGRTNALEGIK